MAFTDPTDDISALLTRQGRAELARSLLGETSFQLTAWQVGRGGYTVVNPVRRDPIDINDTALADPVPDAVTKRAFVTIEQLIGPNVVAPICRLDVTDVSADFGIGELGVFATYLRDDVVPANVGTDFLFAIAHFPLVSKTPSHTLLWRVILAL
jgi:hypothetical protein